MVEGRTGRGVFALLRAVWPRSWWARTLLIAVPLLLVAFAISPFVAAANGALELTGRLFGPLIETATGRLLLLNGILLVAVLVLLTAMRDRLRALRSGLRLRAHLDGIAAFVGGEPTRARELLTKVAESRVPPPADVPEIGAQARLTLTRIELADGNADAAMRWLAEVRESELPDELRRSRARLSFDALDLQAEALPEQLELDLRAALDVAPSDAALLRRLRDLLRARGALEEAASVQQRVLEASTPRDQAHEQRRLALDLVAAGQLALESGADAVDAALAFAERAHRIDPDVRGSSLLRGDALRVRGELAAALREYARAGDVDALMRAAALLDDHPDRLTPREVLEAFPLDGGLLLIAREFARRGDGASAIRAARLAVRSLGDAPEIATALAALLRAAGLRTHAEQLLADPSLAPDAGAR